MEAQIVLLTLVLTWKTPADDPRWPVGRWWPLEHPLCCADVGLVAVAAQSQMANIGCEGLPKSRANTVEPSEQLRPKWLTRNGALH